MKKLSDYKGDEAIELWADLLEPIAKIAGDGEVRKIWESGLPKILVAKKILKMYKKEVTEILLRIDDTPLTGLNIIIRLVNIITEIDDAEELKDFLSLSGQEKTVNVSTGSVMENTEDGEN